MPVDSTHPLYDEFLAKWIRARDVIAGEDAIKAAGEAYVPALDSQSVDEFRAYVARASFFNATGRTAEGFSGMVFRRDPVTKLPKPGTPVGDVLERLRTDIVSDGFQHAANRGVGNEAEREEKPKPYGDSKCETPTNPPIFHSLSCKLRHGLQCHELMRHIEREFGNIHRKSEKAICGIWENRTVCCSPGHSASEGP